MTIQNQSDNCETKDTKNQTYNYETKDQTYNYEMKDQPDNYETKDQSDNYKTIKSQNKYYSSFCRFFYYLNSIICIGSVIIIAVCLILFMIYDCHTTSTAECESCTGLLSNKICNLDCIMFFDIYCENGTRDNTMIITTNTSIAENYTINNVYYVYPYCEYSTDTSYSFEPTYYEYCTLTELNIVLISIMFTSLLVFLFSMCIGVVIMLK